MAQHRASLRQRVRTWWDEKSIPPYVLPIVWVVLSVLLLVGLAFTIPPIIHDILEPDEPKVTQSPSPSPSPTPTTEQTLPPVLTVPSPTPTQESETVEGSSPAGPAPFVPQPQPVPVQPQPFLPQPPPQLPQLPPVVPRPELPTLPQLPSLPEVVNPVVPPILGPVLERPLDTVDKIVGGTLDTVDETVDGVTGTLDKLLP